MEIKTTEEIWIKDDGVLVKSKKKWIAVNNLKKWIKKNQINDLVVSSEQLLAELENKVKNDL